MNILRIAASVALAAVAAFFIVLSYEIAIIPTVLGVYVDSKLDLIGAKLAARDAQIARLLKDTDDLVDNPKNDASVELYHHILLEVDDTLHDARATLIPHAKDTLSAARMLLASVRVDVNALSRSTNGDLAQLDTTIASMNTLLVDLDSQIKEGSPKALQTIDELNKSLSDVDKLLSDPNIQKTIGNVQNSTESVDMALRPLRKKLTLLKAVLSKALSVINIDPFRFIP